MVLISTLLREHTESGLKEYIGKLPGIQVESESESHSVMSDSSCEPMGLYNPWNSPGQNTGVGRFFLLQGIFPTQGLNPGLTLQVDSLLAEPQGKPKNTGVGG